MKNTEYYEELKLKLEADSSASEVQTWSKKYLNSHRRRYLKELALIESLSLSGRKVLEIGSAPFHMTYFLKRKGLAVTGWDIDPERFSQFIESNDLDVEKVNIETDDVARWESQFDLVIFNEVFEHLRINPIETLRKINRVLKPGGKLLMSTPNLTSLGNRVSILLGRGFDNPFEEFNKLNRFGHMGHVREYTASQVVQFLSNTGFTIERINYPNYRNVTFRLKISTIFRLGYQIFPKLRPYFQIISKKA